MDFAAFTRSTTESQVGTQAPFGVETEISRVRSLRIAPQPFAWQNEDQLLLLDVDGPTWLFAELHFLRDECRYEEIRRSSYQWQREAIGALLSRALLNGDDALIDTVEQLDTYMVEHYRVTII
jgi:hypothetical protein